MKHQRLAAPRVLIVDLTVSNVPPFKQGSYTTVMKPQNYISSEFVNNTDMMTDRQNSLTRKVVHCWAMASEHLSTTI
jgi:hypothetical protein